MAKVKIFMLGLRTKEDQRFEKYMELVQSEAQTHGFAFYLDRDAGNNASFEEMDVSDLTGWLIPEENALKFEAVWLLWKKDCTWNGYYRSVHWIWDKKGKINIVFKRLPALSDFSGELAAP